MAPKSCHFGSQIGLWAPRGRLILHFGTFLCDVEKSYFFDVALGRQKINKNQSLERHGTAKGATIRLRGSGFGAEGSQAGGNYQRLSTKHGTNERVG